MQHHTEKNHEMCTVAGLLQGRLTPGTAGATASGLSPQLANKNCSFQFMNSTRRHVSRPICVLVGYQLVSSANILGTQSTQTWTMVKCGSRTLTDTGWPLLGKENELRVKLNLDLVVARHCKMRLWTSSFRFARTTRLTPDGFSWNVTIFPKNCRDNSSFIKIWRSWIRASWHDYENNQQDALYRLTFWHPSFTFKF
jgi:hypothetical protein